MTNTSGSRLQTLSAAANGTRTLYHFTSKRAAQKIIAKGLRANWVLDMPKELIGTMRGVWLTDNPQLPPKFSASAEYRIEIDVPRTDVRLVHWRSMLQERISLYKLAAIDLKAPEWKSFYFYSGNIDASSIRSSERYSTLTAMRECRKAHFDGLAELGVEQIYEQRQQAAKRHADIER